jgi:hypothetical protein
MSQCRRLERSPEKSVGVAQKNLPHAIEAFEQKLRLPHQLRSLRYMPAFCERPDSLREGLVFVDHVVKGELSAQIAHERPKRIDDWETRRSSARSHCGRRHQLRIFQRTSSALTDLNSSRRWVDAILRDDASARAVSAVARRHRLRAHAV